jgi:predicted acyltransferase
LKIEKTAVQATLRFMGVLQRIGIVYIIAVLIAYRASRRTILAITIAALLGYWAVLSLGPLEPPEATIVAQVDRALISTPHLWKQAKTWDPEGPLSTIGAVATALLGVLVTPWVRARNVKMLTIAGMAGIAVGLAWGQLFPINKNLYFEPQVASFLWALAFIGVWLGILWVLDRKGIVLKV